MGGPPSDGLANDVKSFAELRVGGSIIGSSDCRFSGSHPYRLFQYTATARHTAYASRMAGIIQLRARMTMFMVLHPASTALQVKFVFARVNTTAILRCNKKSKAVAAASDQQRKPIRNSVGIPVAVTAFITIKMSTRFLCRVSDTSHFMKTSTHNKVDQTKLIRSIRMNTIARVLRNIERGPMSREKNGSGYKRR